MWNSVGNKTTPIIRLVPVVAYTKEASLVIYLFIITPIFEEYMEMIKAQLRYICKIYDGVVTISYRVRTQRINTDAVKNTIVSNIQINAHLNMDITISIDLIIS